MLDKHKPFFCSSHGAASQPRSQTRPDTSPNAQRSRCLRLFRNDILHTPGIFLALFYEVKLEFTLHLFEQAALACVKKIGRDQVLNNERSVLPRAARAAIFPSLPNRRPIWSLAGSTAPSTSRHPGLVRAVPLAVLGLLHHLAASSLHYGYLSLMIEIITNTNE